MSRVQLALNVADLDAAVDFYEKLFATPAHKRRPGYANFAIDQPPLKLVLFEGGEPGTTSINHLGVEVESPAEVVAAASRLAEAGLSTRLSESDLCCHAVQDKVWAADPNGGEWEVYTVLDDNPDGLSATDDRGGLPQAGGLPQLGGDAAGQPQVTGANACGVGGCS